ncbi:MAG: lipoate--protein ligase family protein [Pleurocapsa sp.]
MQEVYSSSPDSRQCPTWRLIPPLTASGQMQMAIDRWLLEKHRQGEHPPTLRFYTWHPAAISLGYHQQNYPSAWQEILWQGKPLDIVRRPTGGRAVLHQGDLTYAVVTSINPGKRREVYKQICQFLITGWRSLGLDLVYGKDNREYAHDHNCFATATEADLITITGDKVIGSAQLRRGKAILQHGSMMLTTDRNLFAQIFNQPTGNNIYNAIAQDRNSPSEIVSNNNSENTSSNHPSIEKIVTTLSQGAVNCFKIDLATQPLADAEWQDIVTNFLC